MKFSGLDVLFLLCAVSGFVLLGLIMGVNNCKIDTNSLYLVVLPIIGMVGIHFWQLGKRNKVK